jgi:hypothetical protein
LTRAIVPGTLDRSDRAVRRRIAMTNVVRCVGLMLVLAACESLPEGRSAGECRDGADNDGDGAFDCEDTGCMGSPDCDSPPRGDGGVDAGARDAAVSDASASDASAGDAASDGAAPDASADAGPSCRADNQPCDFDSDCCADFCETDGFCGFSCMADGDACSADGDCCSGTCNSFSSTCGCAGLDEPCGDDTDCCSPSLCIAGFCD